MCGLCSAVCRGRHWLTRPLLLDQMLEWAALHYIHTPVSIEGRGICIWWPMLWRLHCTYHRMCVFQQKKSYDASGKKVKDRTKIYGFWTESLKLANSLQFSALRSKMRSGCPALNANIFIVPSWRRPQVLWQFNTASLRIVCHLREASIFGSGANFQDEAKYRGRGQLFADKEIRLFVYPAQASHQQISSHYLSSANDHWSNLKPLRISRYYGFTKGFLASISYNSYGNGLDNLDWEFYCTIPTVVRLSNKLSLCK